MKITEAIAAEHVTLSRMFDQIECMLPRMKSRAEVRTIAAVVEGVLLDHAHSETNFGFAPLDRAEQEKGQLDNLHREHHELDDRLHKVRTAATCVQATRRLRAAMSASREHFHSEERLLFPMIERALKGEQLSALAEAFHQARHPKAWAPAAGGIGYLRRRGSE